jgi:hypothetical protein
MKCHMNYVIYLPQNDELWEILDAKALIIIILKGMIILLI